MSQHKRRNKIEAGGILWSLLTPSFPRLLAHLPVHLIKSVGKFMRQLSLSGIVILSLSLNSWASAAESEQLLVMGEHDLLIQKVESDYIPTQKSIDQSVKIQAKQPLARVLWLPSEYGVLAEEKQLAQQLAAYGVESWFVDFYEALFLAPTASAVDQIPSEWLGRLVSLAKQDGLPLWIIAPNKAAQTAVRGLHKVLQTPQNQIGLVLINPNLYLNTPLPGLEATYWPEVKVLNMPISILQAELSPWRWRLNSLANYFEQGGSDVFLLFQKQVRDRFYFRPDALVIEAESATKLANRILQAMLIQQPYLAEKRQVNPAKILEPAVVKQTRSTGLQAYAGAQDLNLRLPNLQGEKVDLKSYQGKVVLVNFWASWCPPCVHEMPSMSRLKKHFQQQPFEILAVNLGESAEQIQSFVKTHPVNFPILLDQQALAVKEWSVFAYPSSYLIDKNGNIHSALFGGTDWGQAHHLQKIDALLKAP